MENIRVLLMRLTTNLGSLKEVVSIENSNNNQNLNVLLETTLLKLWNITKDLQLENANLITNNFPGIDGVDAKHKIMAQVTSTFSVKKIDDTINQIIEHKHYEKYNQLIFIILRDKKKINETFKKKLAKRINGKFIFDPDKDIIDLNDISNYHHNTQDIQKIHTIVNLLDEVLNYKSSFKESGFDIISVSFHEEELENVFYLVDAIIREGINVYISSKRLYNRFISENHPFKAYLLFAHTTQPVSHVTFCIVILSNSFIKQTLPPHSGICHLYTSAIENEIKLEVISFDRFLADTKNVTESKIKTYSLMQKGTIAATVKRILTNKIRESVFAHIGIDEIEQELITTHNNFAHSKIQGDSNFSLLNLKMPEQDDMELNYIVLTKDYQLNNVLNEFNRIGSGYKKNLNILVPKDLNHKTRRRLDTVKQSFNVNRVYYIDEHLFDKRFKSIEQKPILNTKEFVDPVVMHNGEMLGVNDIIHWIINNSDSNVAIISGSGGIGKTTVCEKIHDIVLSDHERNIIVFIDASKYIEVFRRKTNNDDTEHDLYNIFKVCHPHGNIIDKTSFYLNHALGNIMIIFDGIDEIISTIPSFSLHKFLDNLENLRMKVGKGKILINCRDTYVSEFISFYGEEKKDNILIYELLAFNEDLAERFFCKHFEKTLVRSCLKLAKEFYPNKDMLTEYKYPPFILEIIKQIVDSNFDYSEIDCDFNSQILSSNEINDILVYKICNRECVKKENNGFQLDIDHQVRFMCELAIEEKGRIKVDEFEKILLNIGVNDRVFDVIKGLKDHPLLLKTHDEYVFRFDFFNSIFKSIAIFNIMSTKSCFNSTDRMINIFAIECNYNSLIYQNIQKAFICKNTADEGLKYSKSIIDKIIGKHEGNNNTEISHHEKKAISNILLIILKSKIGSHHDSAYIIKYIFGNYQNGISHFYFIDVPFEAEIIFDFNEIYFTKSEIRNYANFFNCKFDDNTFFDDTCYVGDVYNNKIKLNNINATLQNFDKKIKGDNSIFRIMNVKNNNDKELKRFFREYLNSFYTSKQFRNELLEKSISTLEDDFVTLLLLTKILKDNGIISKTEGGKIVLDERLKSKIVSFLTQGLLFTELSRSISDLRKKMLIGYS